MSQKLQPNIEICKKCPHLRYNETRGIKSFLWFFEYETTAWITYSCGFKSHLMDSGAWNLWTDWIDYVKVDGYGVPDCCEYKLEHIVSKDSLDEKPPREIR